MSSLKNRPFTEAEVADYERRRYRGLDQRWVHGREWRILRTFLAAVRPLPTARILDLPCGYGRFARLLGEAEGRIVSADLSPAMVQKALERQGAAAVPLGVVADAKQGLPFRDGSFGLIFSVRFFHHLHEDEDRRAVLGEIARATSEWAVVSYYRLNPLHRLQRSMRRALKRTRTNIRMIPADVFRGEAEAAGFRMMKARALFPGLHAQTFVLLRKNKNDVQNVSLKPARRAKPVKSTSAARGL